MSSSLFIRARPGHMYAGPPTHRTLMHASQRLGDMHNSLAPKMPGAHTTAAMPKPRETTVEHTAKRMEKKVASMATAASKRDTAMGVYAATKD